jgi:hypothetical protein
LDRTADQSASVHRLVLKMKKAPARGPFGWLRGREARGGVAEARVFGIGLSGAARAKKPGAVSRPGTIREFQFHE